ncbi:MAG: zf-HC2 domain-containing protein [Planctomycetota bacterium]
MKCDRVQQLLSAHLDGELDAQERLGIEQHLEACSGCRAAAGLIAAVSDESRQHFAAKLESAPPPPAHLMQRFTDVSVVASQRSKVRKLMFRTMTGVGVAAAAMLVFMVIPRTSVGETPAQVAERACSHYLNLRNIELLVTPSSEAVQLLETIFDSDSKDADKEEAKGEADADEKRQPLDPFRVYLGAPNRVLVDLYPDDDPTATDGVIGFNGTDFWSYDAAANQLHLQTPGELNLDESELGNAGFDLENADLLAFLSWGFIQELNDASKDGKGHRLTEVTGPYERRIGHRAFEFDLRRETGESDSDDKRFLEITVRVVIDPRSGLIEKTIFDVNLGGLSLIKLQAELVDVDQRLDAGMFDYQRHLKNDTKVIRDDEAEQSKAQRRK